MLGLQRTDFLETKPARSNAFPRQAMADNGSGLMVSGIAVGGGWRPLPIRRRKAATLRFGRQRRPIWQSSRVWRLPRATDLVSLAIQGHDRGGLVTAESLAAGLAIERELLIAAPPGAVKSTAMLQIAEALVATPTFVPIIVPLNERSVDIFMPLRIECVLSLRGP